MDMRQSTHQFLSVFILLTNKQLKYKYYYNESEALLLSIAKCMGNILGRMHSFNYPREGDSKQDTVYSPLRENSRMGIGNRLGEKVEFQMECEEKYIRQKDYF